jgi:hypothetical protein
VRVAVFARMFFFRSNLTRDRDFDIDFTSHARAHAQTYASRLNRFLREEKHTNGKTEKPRMVSSSFFSDPVSSEPVKQALESFCFRCTYFQLCTILRDTSRQFETIRGFSKTQRKKKNEKPRIVSSRLFKAIRGYSRLFEASRKSDGKKNEKPRIVSNSLELSRIASNCLKSLRFKTIRNTSI